MKHLVQSVTLHSDLKKCDIVVAQGSKITAVIEDNEIIKLLDVVPDAKDSQDVVDKYRQTNYILLFSATDIETKIVYD